MGALHQGPPHENQGLEGAGRGPAVPAGFNLNTPQVFPIFLSKHSEQLPGSRLLEGGPPAHHLLAQPLAPGGARTVLPAGWEGRQRGPPSTAV